MWSCFSPFRSRMGASSHRRAESLSCKEGDCNEDFEAWYMPQKIGSEVPACMKAFNVKKELWRSQGPWRRFLERQEEALMQQFSEFMDLTGHPAVEQLERFARQILEEEARKNPDADCLQRLRCKRQQAAEEWWEDIKTYLPGAVETILLNRRALCEVKRQMAAMAAADGASGTEIAHILRPW